MPEERAETFNAHRRAKLRALLALLWASLAGASNSAEIKVGNSPDFATYQLETRAQLQLQRNFQTQAPLDELRWNAPGEWRPPAGTPPSKGILLVHGLGDSPWSFHDLAPMLAAQGFLVRTVLLPGHGTRPEDLLHVDLKQWQRVVNEQTQALQREVEHVYLGGFSTGANLVLDYAYDRPQIAGLLLFSPAFRASSQWGWLAPLTAWLRPWIVSPDEKRPMQNSVRYLNMPTNGFAQFHRSSRNAQQLLEKRFYDKPVFMVVAQHDSVLDTNYLLDKFQFRFTHPASRLIWYGEETLGMYDRQRVLVRKDHLPLLRISQFSHMGLMFAPGNPLYGEQGILRICLNGQPSVATRACEQGALTWYSDWGYREEGKVHARLTFNPYFDWQVSVMATVLDEIPANPDVESTLTSQENHP
jgi:esterase/lipase